MPRTHLTRIIKKLINSLRLLFADFSQPKEKHFRSRWINFWTVFELLVQFSRQPYFFWTCDFRASGTTTKSPENVSAGVPHSGGGYPIPVVGAYFSGNQKVAGVTEITSGEDCSGRSHLSLNFKKLG